MNRKERVLAYIKSPEYVPLKFEELLIVLDVPESDYLEFSAIIKQLENECQIQKTKKGRYIKAENIEIGTLLCSRNGKFGFVSVDNKTDIYVSSKEMKSALHGDKVCVKIYKSATENEIA